MTADPPRYHVGSAHLFQDKGRQLVKCGERNVVVCFYKKRFYALDNACYHHGGPLLEGDIEDMGDHPCIVCPWHHYHITLDTGEGLYRALQMTPSGTIDREAEQKVRSKGRKQRTHDVTVEDGEVYVTLTTSGPRVDSDAYATMSIANTEHTMAKPISNADICSRNLHISVRSGQHLGVPSPLGKQPLPRGVSRGEVLCCTRVEHICGGIKEFFFNCCGGTLNPSLQPGQFVDLELPVSGVSGQLLRRRWTVVETNKEGSVFTVIIKGSERSRGGSTWMLESGLQKRFRLLSVGGNFAFSRNIGRLLEVGGRIVVLSAGIGLTAPYAVLRCLFDKPQTLPLTDGVKVPVFEVVHVHVERGEAFLIRSEDLVRWRFQESTYFTYHLHCYLTEQERETMSNHLLRHLTVCGRRPTLEDVRELVGAFVRASPAVAYISGPPEFVTMSRNALSSLGVRASDIVTDDPDSNSL